MQITLKQREIEAALRLYVTNNGINLNGKTVEIGFTAGRKEGGLIADISIEDTNQADEAPVKPVVIAPAEPSAPEAAVATPAQQDSNPEGENKITSLFGS